MLLRIRRYHGLLLGPARLGLSPADPLSPRAARGNFFPPLSPRPLSHHHIAPC